MRSTKCKTISAVDMVWFTKAAKLEAIGDAVRSSCAEGCTVLGVAHFPDTLAEVRSALEAHSIEYAVIDRLLSPTTLLPGLIERSDGSVLVCLSDRIPSISEHSTGNLGNELLQVIVWERYPLEEGDSLVLAFARACGTGRDVIFHSSLEDALLKKFGSERYSEVLKALGQDEATRMTGKQISSAIRSAQRKVKKKALGDQRVASAEDWFLYNMPR